MEIRNILAATRFAAHKHKDQRRKDHACSPYIVHPIAAAELLIQAGIEDEATIIAAILHDTIEDTETTTEEIALQFGEEIASIVEEVTVVETGIKKDDKQREIDDAFTLSPKAALVRVADKICNIGDVINDTPRGWNEERRNRYFIWAQKVIYATGVENEHLISMVHNIVTEAEKKFGVILKQKQ